MDGHVSIKKTRSLPEGMDFNALRLRGIAYAQELSGDIWTDYNEHDPGVTLIEHLCFALTDLAYRAGFDIKEILYANEGHGAMTIDNGFFPALDILPTTPITATDYRRMLIDTVRDIRNAWFDPVENHIRGYKGLFRIRIQLADDMDRTLSVQQIKDKVRDLIMKNRNLCEDIEEIVVLKTELLYMSATISLEGDAFGEKVLANILHTIEHMLNPSIRYYSKEELEKEGMSTEDIFDGPQPLHGFIKKEDLRPLPENTHVSTLREAISKVTGVKMVKNLTVWKDGQRIIGDEILPGPDSALSLDPKLADSSGKDSGIILIRNGAPVAINSRQTHQFLNTLSAKSKKNSQTKIDLNPAPVSSVRSMKELASYQSFQRLMPAIYGIGPFGLPATANQKRRAQAHQLKAYLLLFEQFMADYLAQLSNVRNLFSIASQTDKNGKPEEHPSTYFSQFPSDIPDGHQLYYHGLDDDAPIKKITKAIQQDICRLSSTFDPSDQRRNRFLDHLLARFGEVYDGEVLKLVSTQSQDEMTAQLMDGKARFLQHFPELSKERSKAFDYSQKAWEEDNVSGLKKRVALQLNFHTFTDPGSGEESFKYYNRSLSQIKPLEGVDLLPKAPTEGERVHLPFRTMLSKGNDSNNYDIIKAGSKFTLQFQDKGADAGAKKGKKQSITLFNGTLKQCTRARDRLIDRFRQINTIGEGFFFLENILLRPTKDPGSILIFEDLIPGTEVMASLRSLYFTDEQALYELSAEILIIGTHPHNWHSLEIEGCWRVVLLKNGQPFMVSAELPTEVDADKVKDHLYGLCETIRDNDPISLNNHLRLGTEQVPGYDVSAAFYTLRLSVIAPDWPALFQENDFNLLLNQIIATNIPSHLSVDYYWLGLREMKEFENLFKSWLEALRTEDQKSTQAISLKIIDLLSPQERTSDTQESTNREQHDKLSSSVITQLGTTFGYTFLFSEGDFSFIQGISPEVISLFPKLNIKNWAQLQRRTAAKMVEGLTEAKYPVSKAEVRHWQKQAKFAINNRWRDMLRLQRQTKFKGLHVSQLADTPTKVERVLREQIRRPAGAINIICYWLENLSLEKPVPGSIIEFLRETIGDGFILPDDDFQVFSGVERDHENLLKDLRKENWQGLSTMKRRSWESLKKRLDSDNELPEFSEFQEEVTLAVNKDFSSLINLQKASKKHPVGTPVEKRLAFHLRLLTSPQSQNAKKERLLISRLKEFSTSEFSSKTSKAAIEKLLDALGFNGLLMENNLQALEGIGEVFEKVLKEAGINSWKELAKADQSWLLRTVALKLNSVTPDTVKEWMDQALLASEGRWQELIQWQKGPLKPITSQGENITPLEAAIDRWMKTHASSTEH